MSLRISKPSLPTTRPMLGGEEEPYSLSGAGGSTLRTRTPSVFQDMSSLEVPNTLKGAFAWCKYLGNWSPIHRAYVEAMTELPTTNLLIKDRTAVSQPVEKVLESKGPERANKNYIEKLIKESWGFSDLAKEVFRSLATYDNAVTVISYPFEKKLICEQCGSAARARSAQWRLSSGAFILNCPSCHYEGEAVEVDEVVDVPEEVRFKTLDMELIDTKYHPLTGKTYVYYTIPATLVEAIEEGDRDLICDTPREIIETITSRHNNSDPFASNEGQPRMKLEEGQYFLSRKPGLPSSETQGLSFPTFAATFKDYWLLLTMRKAQEVIANGWIVPRRFLYPESSAAAGNIFEMLNISDYMGTIRQEIKKHERDPNYQSVIPFPIGELNLGGDAKGLMLSQELRILIESICATLQCPLEFLYGGMSFSASSVTAKKMQVQMDGLRKQVLQLLQWGLDHVSTRMGLPATVIEFSGFRLADDLQYTQMLLSLQQSNIISLRRLHEDLGIESDSEQAAILEDIAFDATIQRSMGKVQADIEAAMGEGGMAAEAEGELAGLRAHIGGLVDLRKMIENDPEMMAVVQSQPELYAQIFGQVMGDEEDGYDPRLPAVPDPENVAPGADQHRTYSQTEPLSDEVLKDLLDTLQEVDFGEQQALLDDIRHQWGEAAFKQVSSKLHEVEMISNIPPEDRPSSTERMIPF